MISLYGTADAIDVSTGGGQVVINEARALGAVSEKIAVISRAELNSARFRQPDSVFLPDYFALMSIQGRQFDLAHFYSGTFSATVRYLKERGTIVTYTVPAHDRRTTVEEHQKQGLEYPWHHIKDNDLWAVFSRGYRDANVVIAPSRRSAEFLSTQGCGRVEVIPHGCNLPQRYMPLPTRFTPGYLGAVGPDKGVSYLLLAWERLNYPDAEMLLAGRESPLLQPLIQRQVNGGRFRILGFVEDVSTFYNSISVYVQPSVCESFGIEVLEAMAHGRPVIVSEGAGASELVTEGAGWVVPIRSPDAIAERLQWCRKNPDRVEEMGRKARKIAEGHTWEIIRARYQELWRSIISPSSGAGGS